MDSISGRCNECCYEFYNSQLYNFNGNLICESCIPNEFSICDKCGNVIKDEEMFCGKCKKCNIELIEKIKIFYSLSNK